MIIKQTHKQQIRLTRYLKGYALCRRLPLASRGCHLWGFGASILTFWEVILAPRAILAPPGGPWGHGLEMVLYKMFLDFGVLSGPV